MMGLRKTAVATVTEMLEIQSKALLNGDLDALGRMAPPLERAFAHLHREGAPKVQLAKIKEAAARNARLLLAAQAGVATARAHLQSSRSPQLTTYGADGRSQATTPAASRTFARR